MGQPLTEAELLDAVGEADEDALRALYDRYYPRLARFLVRMTTDDDLIAEIINDTFFVVWQKAAGFRAESSPSTWIIGICYRKALKALKALARQRPTEPLEAAEPLGTAPDRLETRLGMHRAIARLKPHHRAIVILTYQFGYSYREIGEIVHCPENTVKTRMHHARKALKKLLEAQS